MSFLKRRQPTSLASRIVTSLRDKNNRQSLNASRSLTGRLSVGVESLDSAAYSEVDQDLTSLQNTLSDVKAEATVDAAPEGQIETPVATNPDEIAYEEHMEQVGLESATYAASAFGDVAGWITTARSAAAPGGLVTHAHISAGSGGSFSPVRPALESFDSQTLHDHKEYSIAYNLLAPRQDAFGEALFPTIVGTPNQAYLKVGFDRPGVWSGALHKLNGDITKFVKKNLIEAFRDHTVLENQDTRLIPFPSDAPGNDNTAHFIDEALVADRPFDVNGVGVPTRPLKMNAPAFNYLGVCAHPGLATAGLLDQTDAIDRFVRLDKVNIVITKVADGTKQVVSIDTSRMPRNQFVPVREGHWRDVRMNFVNEALKIGTSTTAMDLSTLDFVTALAGKTVSFRTRIDSDLNVETGVLETRGGSLTPVKVVDADGEVLDLTSIAGVLSAYTLSIEGYTLEARRTNSNRRTRGLLLDRDRYEEVFEILLHPPMSMQKPMANDDTAFDLDTLIKSTHVRISNLAVTTLLNYADMLKEQTADQSALDSSTADIYTGGDFEGIARLVVTPFYDEFEIDLEQVVNNVSSKDRLTDLSGYFVGVIQELAYRMLQESGYKPALEVMGTGSATPELIIATDNRLSQFIMIPGDDRTAGPTMSHKLVETSDKRMRDKIFLTFGSKTSGELNFLGFGNLIWIPELVSEIPVNRNGATLNETMVQPRFRHIVHLPILARIDVVGLEKVLQTRTPINFKQI